MPAKTADTKKTGTQATVDRMQNEQKAESPLDRVQPRDQTLINWFTHHPPDAEQAEAYQRIRSAALAFAEIVKANTPGCPDQTAAIRKIREAVFTANAAIACRGR